MRRVIPLLILVVLLVPGLATALTLRDLIELSRAGLGDEVLLALIDVDRPVFNIDAGTLKSLKAAGVSDRVIVAVVRSGRPPAGSLEEVPQQVTDPAQDAVEPQVIVIDHHDAPAEVREVAVPVPVYIPIVASRQRFRDDRVRDGELDRDRSKRAEPVYWGWGGKRRPDAWKESPVPPTPRPCADLLRPSAVAPCRF